MDWDLFMNLMARGARFVHLLYPVGAFRVHDDRITAKPPPDAEEQSEVASRFGLPRHVCEDGGVSRRTSAPPRLQSHRWRLRPSGRSPILRGRTSDGLPVPQRERHGSP